MRGMGLKGYGSSIITAARTRYFGKVNKKINTQNEIGNYAGSLSVVFGWERIQLNLRKNICHNHFVAGK